MVDGGLEPVTFDPVSRLPGSLAVLVQINPAIQRHAQIGDVVNDRVVRLAGLATQIRVNYAQRAVASGAAR